MPSDLGFAIVWLELKPLEPALADRGALRATGSGEAESDVAAPAAR